MVLGLNTYLFDGPRIEITLEIQPTQEMSTHRLLTLLTRCHPEAFY